MLPRLVVAICFVTSLVIGREKNNHENQYTSQFTNSRFRKSRFPFYGASSPMFITKILKWWLHYIWSVLLKPVSPKRIVALSVVCEIIAFRRFVIRQVKKGRHQPEYSNYRTGSIADGKINLCKAVKTKHTSNWDQKLPFLYYLLFIFHIINFIYLFYNNQNKMFIYNRK